MDGTAASKPAPIMDGLLAAMKDAVASIEAYGEDAKASMSGRLAAGGKVDRKLLDVHQHSAHGLSWVITYVETLREVAGWADRLERTASDSTEIDAGGPEDLAVDLCLVHSAIVPALKELDVEEFGL